MQCIKHVLAAGMANKQNSKILCTTFKNKLQRSRNGNKQKSFTCNHDHSFDWHATQNSERESGRSMQRPSVTESQPTPSEQQFCKTRTCSGSHALMAFETVLELPFRMASKATLTLLVICQKHDLHKLLERLRYVLHSFKFLDTVVHCLAYASILDKMSYVSIHMYAGIDVTRILWQVRRERKHFLHSLPTRWGEKLGVNSRLYNYDI